MSPENDKALCEAFPKIFINRNKNPKVSCMSFGFECGDGWYDVIYTLCGDIQHHIDHNLDPKVDKDSTQVVATQVKEKFGGLRFYYQGGDATIDGMVGLAESLSYKICETCGNKGKAYNDGWIRTHCEKCELEYQEKRKAR